MTILNFFCVCVVEFPIESKGTEHPASLGLRCLASFENFLVQ